MKRVVKVRLLPTEREVAALTATLSTCNAPASWLSARVHTKRAHNKVDAQRLFYDALRQQFGLSAQLAIRIIGKVVDAYASQRRKAKSDHCGSADPQRLTKEAKAALHWWAFDQLGRFLAYKARGAGVAFVHVNPAYTSQTCSDFVAMLGVARWGEVMRPHAAPTLPAS